MKSIRVKIRALIILMFPELSTLGLSVDELSDQFLEILVNNFNEVERSEIYFEFHGFKTEYWEIRHTQAPQIVRKNQKEFEILMQSKLIRLTFPILLEVIYTNPAILKALGYKKTSTFDWQIFRGEFPVHMLENIGLAE